MTTEKTYHFMSVVPGKGKFFVCADYWEKANLGMDGLPVGALPKVAPLCPSQNIVD